MKLLVLWTLRKGSWISHWEHLGYYFNRMGQNCSWYLSPKVSRVTPVMNLVLYYLCFSYEFLFWKFESQKILVSREIQEVIAIQKAQKKAIYHCVLHFPWLLMPTLTGCNKDMKEMSRIEFWRWLLHSQPSISFIVLLREIHLRLIKQT